MTRLPTLGPRGEGWVALQLVLLLLVAAAGTLGPAWEGAWRVASSILGIALAGAGALLAIRGLVDLREALTPLPHPRRDADLVDRGVYRLVRHPIYGGIAICATGYALLTASPTALVGAAAVLGFFDLKARLEERWLEAAYAAYPAYRARTRKLIPFVY